MSFYPCLLWLQERLNLATDHEYTGYCPTGCMTTDCVSTAYVFTAFVHTDYAHHYVGDHWLPSLMYRLLSQRRSCRRFGLFWIELLDDLGRFLGRIFETAIRIAFACRRIQCCLIEPRRQALCCHILGVDDGFV